MQITKSSENKKKHKLKQNADKEPSEWWGSEGKFFVRIPGSELYG